MPLLPRTVAAVALALVCLAPTVDAASARSYTFMLALERDQGALDRLALRASAPASGRRGAYLPLAQVERRFGASAATRRAVTAFLRHRGARGRVRGLGGSRGPVFRDIRTGGNDLYDVGCCTAGPNYDSASGLGSLGLRAIMYEALG